MICSGCQPNRTDSRGPIGAKHRPSPTHRCSHNGCFCDLCNPQYAWRPLSKDEWEESVHALEALGSFYIDNTKILIEMVKQKKLKPNMKPKEKA